MALYRSTHDRRCSSRSNPPRPLFPVQATVYTEVFAANAHFYEHQGFITEDVNRAVIRLKTQIQAAHLKVINLYNARQTHNDLSPAMADVLRP